MSATPRVGIVPPEYVIGKLEKLSREMAEENKVY